MRLRLVLMVALGIALSARGSQLLDQLKQEYTVKDSIELVAGEETFPVASSAGQIAGKNVSATEIDLYLYVFRKEFGKYPREIFPLLQLKRVVFCRELTVGALPQAAVASWDNNTLYLDVRSGVYGDVHRRKMLHHEIFRMMDFANDGGFGRDPDWVALNGADFFYGGELKLDEPSMAPTHPGAGFISKLAKTSVVEDKAEVFSHMMVYDVKVQLLLKEDSNLVRKLELLKQELGGFCQQLDAAFWTRAGKF